MQLDSFWKSPPSTEQQTRDAQENILILIRGCYVQCISRQTLNLFVGKLREGIVASKRNDAFAVEGRTRLSSVVFRCTTLTSHLSLRNLLVYRHAVQPPQAAQFYPTLLYSTSIRFDCRSPFAAKLLHVRDLHCAHQSTHPRISFPNVVPAIDSLHSRFTLAAVLKISSLDIEPFLIPLDQ